MYLIPRRGTGLSVNAEAHLWIFFSLKYLRFEITSPWNIEHIEIRRQLGSNGT
jgi:hypothetical protein